MFFKIILNSYLINHLLNHIQIIFNLKNDLGIKKCTFCFSCACDLFHKITVGNENLTYFQCILES